MRLLSVEMKFHDHVPVGGDAAPNRPNTKVFGARARAVGAGPTEGIDRKPDLVGLPTVASVGRFEVFGWILGNDGFFERTRALDGRRSGSVLGEAFVLDGFTGVHRNRLENRRDARRRDIDGRISSRLF